MRVIYIYIYIYIYIERETQINTYHISGCSHPGTILSK